METNVEYEFTLPEQNGSVQSIGFSHGIGTLPAILFQNMEPGAPLPDRLLMRAPTNLADIEEMVHALITDMLHDEGEDERTNDPKMYREYYAKGFIAGYRFGLWALERGLLEALYPLSFDQRSEVNMRMAYKLILPDEEVPEMDDRMILESFDEVQELYKQYRRQVN